MPKSVKIHVDPTVLRAAKPVTGGSNKPWLTDGYRDYIASPRWQRLRERKLRSAGRACERCNGTDQLQVHHRTYVRLGNEELSDLAVLCHDCHETVHYVEGWKRRIDAIACKRYGSDWHDRSDAELIERRIADWLENGAD